MLATIEPSTSVSLLVKLKDIGVSSFVEATSLFATGAVLILIPKLTLVMLLFAENVIPVTLPSVVPSLPAVVLSIVFFISPLFVQLAGKVLTGVVPLAVFTLLSVIEYVFA